MNDVPIGTKMVIKNTNQNTLFGKIKNKMEAA